MFHALLLDSLHVPLVAQHFAQVVHLCFISLSSLSELVVVIGECLLVNCGTLAFRVVKVRLHFVLAPTRVTQGYLFL